MGGRGPAGRVLSRLDVVEIPRRLYSISDGLMWMYVNKAHRAEIVYGALHLVEKAKEARYSMPLSHIG